MNVLVVDDSEAIRGLLADALPLCYPAPPWERVNVFTCHDGLSAWQAMENEYNTFDLVVTDCEMPGIIDGLELTKRVKTYCRIPVIVMSGNNMETSALDAGADGFLKKPFKLEELREAIRQVFSF